MARRIRAKCLKGGHKIRSIPGVFLPFAFCHRWLCEYSVAVSGMPEAMAETAERRNAELRVVGWVGGRLFTGRERRATVGGED